MSISPVSDLVMDVARAADPRRVAEAALKLGAGGGPAVASDFAALVGGKSNAVNAAPPRSPPTVAWNTAPRRIASAPAGGPTSDAYRALETLMLQKMLEGALPNTAGASFGKGVAGDTWKSMLAEHIAQRVAPNVFPLGRHPRGGLHETTSVS